ncbi:MAG: ABC transporter permease [Acetobacteraceae bacterium]|nr:ABC transporter permease [Acetobacteraceae bacterium]
MNVADGAERRTLRFAGRLDADGAARIWDNAMRAARQTGRNRTLSLDLADVAYCDLSGTALLLTAEAAHAGRTVTVGASEELQALLDRARATSPRKPAPYAGNQLPGADPLGLLRAGLRSAANGAAFIGEALIALWRVPERRRMLQPVEVMRFADQAGVRSVPLLLLLGTLIGLILAFQSAVPMRRFGADLYVVNLVSISLLRELGALLAAVILAGRTGSAFAAEIGTMKVNEEIDALTVMGLDPMTMLVLPRMMAAMLVMPAMTLLLDIAGLAGMTVVMMAFGFPLVAVVTQIGRAVHVGDLVQGLVKSVAFGAAIGAIGCREGLGTGAGPRAVGLAATGAVVGGIVSTILLDGLFAIIIYRLGF